MKKILIISGTIIVVAVTLFILFKGNGKEPKFRFDKVLRGDVEMAVTATGTVNPVTTVLVGTRVSGTIKNIYVDFNAPVKKGQLTALIDPALFEAEGNQASANLLSAKAKLFRQRHHIGPKQENDFTVRNLTQITQTAEQSAYKASLLDPIEALRYE